MPDAMVAPASSRKLTTFAAAVGADVGGDLRLDVGGVVAATASHAVAATARKHFVAAEGAMPIAGAGPSLCTVCMAAARYTCTKCLGLHGTLCSVECLATHRATRCNKHVV